MSEIVHLHEYQKEVVRFFISHGAAGALLSPGLGKTLCTLAAFHILKQKKYVNRALVIAPLRVCTETWPAEIRKWGFDFSFEVLHGPKKQANLAKQPDVCIINYEGLDWLKDQDLSGLDMLVVDECTKIKSPATKRFKIVKKLLPNFRRRFILTGSPAPNGLMDLFGQIYVLDMGEALGRYITHFRANYFQPDGQFGWAISPNGEKRIYEAIRPLVLRKDAKDHLDLPEVVHTPHRIPLPAAARNSYQTLEKSFLIHLDQGEVTAANAGTVSQKLRQFANGAIYLDSDMGARDFAVTHDAKIDALVDLVEELQGSPAIVAYEFHHDLERLRKAFPNAPHVGGGVSTTKTHEVLSAWEAGKVPVLLVQSASVAHGLNLQYGPGHTLIWFGLTWDLETTEQLIMRLHRQGQTHRVIVHWLLMKDTVDETIYRVLQQKDKTQRELLEALKVDISARHGDAPEALAS